MKGINQKFLNLLLVSYAILVFYWMVLGFGRINHPEFMYNLKPFFTISNFLQFDKFNRNIWIVNIFGNIGVFVPFGLLLPMALGGKMRKSFIIFLSGLLVLEFIQLLSRRGSFDIDDFILNSLGFVIGYGIYKILAMWVKSRRGDIANTKTFSKTIR